MNFLDLWQERLYKAHTIPNFTRRTSELKGIHGAIADFIKENSSYDVQDMRTHEYQFINSKNMGSKKVDIALLKDGKLKGAILFKTVCKDYNKNANNYYENMKGEAAIFIEDNIPIYQMMWLPTYLPCSKSNGKKGWEIPIASHFRDYDNFIAHRSSYWDPLQVDIFFFDVDYANNYQLNYSNSNELKLYNGNKTIEEGLLNFIKKVEAHG